MFLAPKRMVLLSNSAATQKDKIRETAEMAEPETTETEATVITEATEVIIPAAEITATTEEITDITEEIPAIMAEMVQSAA